MTAILVHERERTSAIEAGTQDIWQVCRSINTAHRGITELTTLGESVLGWYEEDCCAYRAKRLRLDSLLLTLCWECVRFVRPEQIDTLRMLLAAKESHLLRIMQSFRQRETVDSLIAHQLPTVVTSVVQAPYRNTAQERHRGLLRQEGHNTGIFAVAEPTCAEQPNKYFAGYADL